MLHVAEVCQNKADTKLKITLKDENGLTAARLYIDASDVDEVVTITAERIENDPTVTFTVV